MIEDLPGFGILSNNVEHWLGTNVTLFALIMKFGFLFV